MVYKRWLTTNYPEINTRGLLWVSKKFKVHKLDLQNKLPNAGFNVIE